MGVTRDSIEPVFDEWDILDSTMAKFQEDSNPLEAGNQATCTQGTYPLAMATHGTDAQATYPQAAQVIQGTYTQGMDTQDTYAQATYPPAQPPRIDTQGTYLQGMDIQDTYFQGTYFQGTYFQGTYFQGTYFQGTYFQGTYPQGMNTMGQAMTTQAAYPLIAQTLATDAQAAQAQAAHTQAAQPASTHAITRQGRVQPQGATSISDLESEAADMDVNTCLMLFDDEMPNTIISGNYFKEKSRLLEALRPNPDQMPGETAQAALTRRELLAQDRSAALFQVWKLRGALGDFNGQVPDDFKDEKKALTDRVSGFGKYLSQTLQMVFSTSDVHALFVDLKLAYYIIRAMDGKAAADAYTLFVNDLCRQCQVRQGQELQSQERENQGCKLLDCLIWSINHANKSWRRALPGQAAPGQVQMAPYMSTPKPSDLATNLRDYIPRLMLD